MKVRFTRREFAFLFILFVIFLLFALSFAVQVAESAGSDFVNCDPVMIKTVDNPDMVNGVGYSATNGLEEGLYWEICEVTVVDGSGRYVYYKMQSDTRPYDLQWIGPKVVFVQLDSKYSDWPEASSISFYVENTLYSHKVFLPLAR